MHRNTLLRLLAKAGLILGYLGCLYIPIHAFFTDRGGVLFLRGQTVNVQLQLIFPLLGLYAFTFVTLQVLLATNLHWLRRLWPNIIRFHRFQGTFALLFAVLHPSFILFGFGLADYLHFRYVAPDLRWWLLPSYTALILLLGTVSTAILAWRGANIPWWRKLHKLNYLIFALVWVHSWFIGSDTPTPFLRKVWIIYLLLVILSTCGKYRSTIIKLFGERKTPA